MPQCLVVAKKSTSVTWKHIVVHSSSEGQGVNDEGLPPLCWCLMIDQDDGYHHLLLLPYAGGGPCGCYKMLYKTLYKVAVFHQNRH